MADRKRWQRFMKARENTPAIRYSPVTSRKNIRCHDPRKAPPPATPPSYCKVPEPEPFTDAQCFRKVAETLFLT
ncbi:unnamed protein product [Ixodes persulcatus]